MSATAVRTYQTRLPASPADAALAAYAELYGRAERTLFAALRAGQKLNDLKRAFLPRFGVTARQFNAVRVGLDGKIAAIAARRPDLIGDLETKVKAGARGLARLATELADLRDPAAAFGAGRTVRTRTEAQRRKEIAKNLFATHGKKRRQAWLEARLAALRADESAGAVRLCFGSKKLFRAQFDLEANGYANLDEWREDWRSSRSSQFLVLGSKDETAGCQGCRATVGDDGSLTLAVRMPDGLVAEGHPKFLTLANVKFEYGHAEILAALATSRKITGKTKAGKVVRQRTGTALGYRFLRDAKGWRVFASVAVEAPDLVSSRLLGAIGIDVNADHLAVAEVDRFGNYVGGRALPLDLAGKTSGRSLATIRDLAAEIAAEAKAAGKPVVLEGLDFRRKKAELARDNPRRAHMLSSFAYGKILAAIGAACFRAGVEVIGVNPAWTSVIGAVNFAVRYGIPTHRGAALAIARRGLGLREKPAKATKVARNRISTKAVKRSAEVASPQGVATAPPGDGDHVTLPLPERNRGKHVWSQWSGVGRLLGAARQARLRSVGVRAPPAPLRPAAGNIPQVPASRAFRSRSAEIRPANRAPDR